MTPQEREVMQMALDWADKNGEAVFAVGGWEAVRALNKWSQPLRAALAQPIEPDYSKAGFGKPQPEQEPVAWMYNGNLHIFDPSDWADGTVTPLYNSPPQREWQGLTDEERKEIMRQQKDFWGLVGWEWECMKAIEAKLREKNGNL